MRGLIRLTFIICLLPLVPSALGDDWPAFRGPSGNGFSDDQQVPVNWSQKTNILWKSKLPRPGNGSPIVSNGRVFVTSAEDAEGHQRSLYCFDRKSGKQRWVQTVPFDEQMPTHETNPYCGSTPVADGQRVVVWHGSAGLHCYDFSGKQIWSRDLGQFKHMWGYGSSPVLYKDRILLNCGPGRRVFVTAIDLKSGRTLWETDEPQEGDGERNEKGKYMGSWSTPVIANVDGQDQVICCLPTRLNAYDPKTGDIIWTCDGIRGPKGDLAYSSAMISGDLCVMIGGFSGPGMGLRLGGMGNITERNRLWRKETNPQSIGTGVFIGRYIFRPNAKPGTIDCLEAETGKVVWQNRGAGAFNWGSVVASGDGNLYLTNQDGATVVFKPNPEQFELVAVNELGESSNATPAISGGNIFIRTMEHLYCIGQ